MVDTGLMAALGALLRTSLAANSILQLSEACGVQELAQRSVFPLSLGCDRQTEEEHTQVGGSFVSNSAGEEEVDVYEGYRELGKMFTVTQDES